MTEMNWQSGKIELLSNAGMEPMWSLLIAGDWAPCEHAQAMTRDPIGFYGDLGPVLRDADLAIVNVEGVLGDAGKPVVKDGCRLRLPAAAVEGLVAGSFHLACLANNHSMDFGPQGLARTQQLLADKEIASVGAGVDGQEACRPFLTSVGGVRLAVVNAAEGEEGRSVNDGPGVADFDRGRLVRQITALRARADVVVAILHAGREFVPMPPPYVQRAYRALVDAGADLVVGHHPHVPQGVEIYHGRPIVYSVGNFTLWLPNGSSFGRLGYLVKALFHRAQLGSVEIVPYRIYADRLTPLDDDKRAAFLADLARVSIPLTDPAQVEQAWRAYADRWLDHGLAEELIVFSSLLLEEVDLRAAWLSALSGRGDVRARLARRIARILSGWAARLTDGQGGRHQAQGAAILRNRFDTLAHRELYLTALQNCMNQERGSEPDWAFDLIERWGVFAR